MTSMPYVGMALKKWWQLKISFLSSCDKLTGDIKRMVAELREALDSREPVSNVIVTQEGDFQESLTATKEPPVLIQEGLLWG